MTCAKLYDQSWLSFKYPELIFVLQAYELRVSTELQIYLDKYLVKSIN